MRGAGIHQIAALIRHGIGCNETSAFRQHFKVSTAGKSYASVPLVL